MHPNNPFRGDYPLAALAELVPELRKYFITTKAGTLSLDFSHPQAVKWLNKALLLKQYAIRFWDVPDSYLTPPVPGRLDYLLAMADLLAEGHGGEIPKGKAIRLLDIGTGASCIFPLLAQAHFGWLAVGSEVDAKALKAARAIAQLNPSLKGKIEIRHQTYTDQIFVGVTQAEERFDCCVCNPPFYTSAAAAAKASDRKWAQLGKNPSLQRNFGGQAHELHRPGGEKAFALQMVRESQERPNLCGWFSVLLSNKAHETPVYQALLRAKAARVEVLPLTQGNKEARAIAWRFA